MPSPAPDFHWLLNSVSHLLLLVGFEASAMSGSTCRTAQWKAGWVELSYWAAAFASALFPFSVIQGLFYNTILVKIHKSSHYP